LSCVVCGSDAGPVEEAKVRSNVRAFAAEEFAVWRCGSCRSIHATDEVDLAHYYAKYPFHAGKLDGFGRAAYGNQLRRLEACGLRPGAKILDDGCGNGLFVEFLRGSGYPDAVGYDAFNARFADPSVRDGVYDAVVSQDVVEHVPDPGALLDGFARCVKPGGLVAIGTPDAGHIDLSKPEALRHALHQPYHRHILSKDALVAMGMKRGWTVERHYPTQYVNTWTPCVNVAFLGALIGTSDGTIDAVFEGPTWKFWALLPLIVPVALFGTLLAPMTDGMVVFRAR
jgi:2-polyprenyl-3-methyl-5-hydroxy-6-metoxy-1,4-benzoquinol methylase